METFVFLFQGNANHLFSRTANTGVAKAYFDDGVKRGKLTPGTEMISSKDGVDIIGDCPWERDVVASSSPSFPIYRENGEVASTSLSLLSRSSKVEGRHTGRRMPLNVDLTSAAAH